MITSLLSPADTAPAEELRHCLVPPVMGWKLSHLLSLFDTTRQGNNVSVRFCPMEDGRSAPYSVLWILLRPEMDHFD